MRRNFVSAAFLLLIKCKLNAPDLIFSFICDTIHLYQAKIYFQSENILSENQKKDSIVFVHDTLFRENIKVDTTLNDN